jgi:hypothetical protein
MRYNKNFYYMNIDQTNNRERILQEDSPLIEEFQEILSEHYDYPDSLIEFGCDLGLRLERLNIPNKAGFEFDHTAGLYIGKHSRVKNYCFQSLEDFVGHNPPHNEPKMDCGLCLDFFKYFDCEDHNVLISKMLEYCDLLVLVSKDLTAEEMASRVSDKFESYEVKSENVENFNFLFVTQEEFKDE